MKSLTVPHLRRLIARPGTPCVSIYMSTNPGGRDGAADAARFRALLHGAAQLLSRHLGRDEIDSLLLPIVRKARELPPSEGRGLVFFHSPRLTAAFSLPVAVPDLAVVASTFHTKPLVSFLDGGQRFYVLALGRGLARLLEATPAGLVSVNDVPILTSSPDEPVNHRALDAAVCRELSATGAWLVLAGSDEERSGYASTSKYPWLLERAIDCWDVEQVPLETLHRVGTILVRAHQAEVEGAAVAQFHSARARGQGSDDLDEIARAAAAGRVHLLLHRAGAHVWGRFDRRTGAHHVRGTQVEAGDVDLLDELCELTLLHGGDVVEMSPERMPTPSLLAAVLRSHAPLPRNRRRGSTAVARSPRTTGGTHERRDP
jgi:hypothetical protein